MPPTASRAGCRAARETRTGQPRAAAPRSALPPAWPRRTAPRSTNRGARRSLPRLIAPAMWTCPALRRCSSARLVELRRAGYLQTARGRPCAGVSRRPSFAAHEQRERDVIDVYTWTTGNSRKIPIFLEEAEVPYRLHMVNIRTGEQFKPEFVAICPNSKVPAIVDQDGPGGAPYALFE